jgi:CDP-glucose 4,6-dehydratase
MSREFWRGRRVLVTGHTGFKGGWLVTWLLRMGAEVTGYALPPQTVPNLFEAAGVAEGIRSRFGDVRDAPAVRTAVRESEAEIVFHLAAQSLVRASYLDPVGTYATNVMGTVHLLDAIRSSDSVRAAVIVTSDKCYENREWPWAYRENDRLGGRDPYSNSKACAELVTSAYRSSFFGRGDGPVLATARAGNVIGGGDWAADRLVPDLLRAFAAGEPAVIRHPAAIRPWQHVLEPLHGYLLLAEAMLSGRSLAGAWNFGPDGANAQPVRWVANRLASRWGGGASWREAAGEHPHEATTLQLDSSRARVDLDWTSRLPLDMALEWIVEWHRDWLAAPGESRALVLRQIARYESLLE